MRSDEPNILWLETLRLTDIGAVGGKNASLGEMIQELTKTGIRVPGGFAVTSYAYRRFLDHNGLVAPITDALEALARGEHSLAQTGASIRAQVEAGVMPDAVETDLRSAYAALEDRAGRVDVDVAVRSSATAEDLPEASFAGQQESYLNVQGADSLVEHVRLCFASLFTDRAITYREINGFDHMEVGLSAAVQQMVRSDSGAAGVAFTLDTESGFPGVVVITGAWGLGENVVKGTITPDEFRVFKPLLNDETAVPILERSLGPKHLKMTYADGGGTQNLPTTKEEQHTLVLDDAQVLLLARWCVQIETHYGRPMDVEWALDGVTDELFIVQARAETVQAREGNVSRTYTLDQRGTVLCEGVAVGSSIATGKAFFLNSMAEADRFEDGGILIAEMTDPDWVPLMKRSSGIVTNRGGRTSHAAIVSRELGITAIVGADDATTRIQDGQMLTISCAEGPRGFAYEGELSFQTTDIDYSELPDIETTIQLNVADPQAAMQWWRLPVQGIGLARLEFIIDNHVRIHPMALVHYDRLQDPKAKAEIAAITAAYSDKKAYFVDKLAAGIAILAASQWPNPVIVRMSDFKTNEYADLLGGREFEPTESNPMIGFRGASRYYSDQYRDGFALECQAIRKVRETVGLRNVVVMIPFCRTLEEADNVLRVMAEEGLERGVDGLEVYVMAEIPSNIILAAEFAERFDGFSIGSNDLTQLTLGIDRDNDRLAALFDERNPAVTRSIEQLIRVAHANDTHVGICGQAPSDHPAFAEFLVRAGIDAISLNPDSVVGVIRRLAARQATLTEDVRP